MNVNLINGAQQSAGYVPQVKIGQSQEPILRVPKVEYLTKGKIGNPNTSKKAQEHLEKLKRKFYDLDVSVVSNKKMEEIKQDPSKFGSTNQTSVFISEEELEKMCSDEKYAADAESKIREAADKIPEIKNELDKKGAPISNLGIIYEKGEVNMFAQVDKTPKSEADKLFTRTQEKLTEEHEEEVKEIRKKYAPKHRPSDETTIIKRNDKITIISNSLLDLSAAISEFGMDYFIKPQPEVGVNVDAKA